MKVGYRIREIRESKKLSQENMAEALRMSVNGYGKIERNEVDINIERLQQIADVLQISPEDVLKNDSVTITNFGKVNGQQYVHFNMLPEKLQELYETNIRLLNEKITTLESEIVRLKSNT